MSKTTQYNLSNNFYFLFSACFIFWYYLITSSMQCSIIIFVIEHISVISCYKRIPCASDFKRYLLTLYHIISLPISVLSRLLFISWSSPPSSLFSWLCAQLYLKVCNRIYVLKWYIIHSLIYFGFIECLYMHLFLQVFGGNFGKNNLTSRQSKQEYLKLRELTIDLTLSSCVWGSRFSTPPLLTP